jgi:hypothetical protein
MVEVTDWRGDVADIYICPRGDEKKNIRIIDV